MITDNATKFVFSAVVANKGDSVREQPNSVFDFEFYLSPERQITAATRLTGVTFDWVDAPSRAGPFHTGDRLSFVNVMADVNPSKEDIIGNRLLDVPKFYTSD